jgi:hypothetical protein
VSLAGAEDFALPSERVSGTPPVGLLAASRAARKAASTARRAALLRRFGWRTAWTTADLRRDLGWETGLPDELAAAVRDGELVEIGAGRWARPGVANQVEPASPAREVEMVVTKVERRTAVDDVRDYLRAHPPSTAKDIAAGTNRSLSGVWSALQTMTGSGVATKRGEGPGTTYTLTAPDQVVTMPAGTTAIRLTEAADRAIDAHVLGRVAEALGLPETATDAEVVAAAGALRERTARAEAWETEARRQDELRRAADEAATKAGHRVLALRGGLAKALDILDTGDDDALIDVLRFRLRESVDAEVAADLDARARDLDARYTALRDGLVDALPFVDAQDEDESFVATVRTLRRRAEAAEARLAATEAERNAALTDAEAVPGLRSLIERLRVLVGVHQVPPHAVVTEVEHLIRELRDRQAEAQTLESVCASVAEAIGLPDGDEMSNPLVVIGALLAMRRVA